MRLPTSLHPRESKVPDATSLDNETGNAPPRVTLRVDHTATAGEAVLVGGLEHADAPIVRVQHELPLLDLPRMRRVDLVTPVVAGVLRQLCGRELGGISARERHFFSRRANDHVGRGVALEADLGARAHSEAAAFERLHPRTLTRDGEQRVAH